MYLSQDSALKFLQNKVQIIIESKYYCNNIFKLEHKFGIKIVNKALAEIFMGFTLATSDDQGRFP